MVVHEVISAGCGDGLQLMVRKLAAEMLPGSRQGVVELVVGVVHPIYLEDGLETSFVETGVVRKEMGLLKNVAVKKGIASFAGMFPQKLQIIDRIIPQYLYICV